MTDDGPAAAWWRVPATIALPPSCTVAGMHMHPTTAQLGGEAVGHLRPTFDRIGAAARSAAGSIDGRAAVAPCLMGSATAARLLPFPPDVDGKILVFLPSDPATPAAALRPLLADATARFFAAFLAALPDEGAVLHCMRLPCTWLGLEEVLAGERSVATAAWEGQQLWRREDIAAGVLRHADGREAALDDCLRRTRGPMVLFALPDGAPASLDVEVALVLVDPSDPRHGELVHGVASTWEGKVCFDDDSADLHRRLQVWHQQGTGIEPSVNFLRERLASTRGFYLRHDYLKVVKRLVEPTAMGGDGDALDALASFLGSPAVLGQAVALQLRALEVFAADGTLPEDNVVPRQRQLIERLADALASAGAPEAPLVAASTPVVAAARRQRWSDLPAAQRDAFRLALGEHANRRAKAFLAEHPELITRWFR